MNLPGQSAHFSRRGTRFKYDHRNRRVARFDGESQTWTYFVFDDYGNILSEVALVTAPVSRWQPLRDYVWLDGRLLSIVEYVGSPPDQQRYVYYAHLDPIGQPRALTNEIGQVVWIGTPGPYGEMSEATAADSVSGRTVVTNLRLPGQYDERLLGTLGLQGPYYNWHRWYLPSVGRYLELDPIAKAGGFNGEYGPDWYTYAGGNPTRNADRDGRMAGGVVVGAVAVGVLALGAYLLKNCIETCTGAKLGDDPKCPSDHSNKKSEAACMRLCMQYLVLPLCVGLGDGASCMIQEGVNQGNGDPNGDTGD